VRDRHKGWWVGWLVGDSQEQEALSGCGALRAASAIAHSVGTAGGDVVNAMDGALRSSVLIDRTRN
jgi:hypothetical protein